MAIGTIAIMDLVTADEQRLAMLRDGQSETIQAHQLAPHVVSWDLHLQGIAAVTKILSR
jgi:invasion protein IalB